MRLQRLLPLRYTPPASALEQLQADVDQWIESYNAERTHSGKYCYGKTPMQTFFGWEAVGRCEMIEKAYSGWELTCAVSVPFIEIAYFRRGRIVAGINRIAQ